MQLLAEVLELHLSALYNRGTSSSTSRLLGKCAVYAAQPPFRFSISVAVNLVHFLMINRYPFSVHVMNGCSVRWHPFSRAELTKRPDALSCHQLMNGYDFYK